MTTNQLADLLEEAARRLRGESTSVDSENALQLYTETEVAKLLRIGRPTIRKILKPIRISRNGKRYRASDIQKFIEEKAKESF